MLDDLLDAVAGTPGRIGGIALALGLGVVIGRGLRPVAKTAIRGYLSASDRVRGAAAEACEAAQDLYEEATTEEPAAEERPPADEAAALAARQAEARERRRAALRAKETEEASARRGETGEEDGRRGGGRRRSR